MTSSAKIAALASAADTAPIAAHAGRGSCLGPAGPLPVILAGTFMVTLDFFIVNVAVPSIQQDLHASDAAVQWVAAAYGLAYAAMLICGGRLGDMFGRRRMFGLGLAGFILASTVCGLAASPALMISGRIAQGLAAAMISPQVLAMLGTLFVDQARTRAFSAYGLTLGLAAVGGQLIGGLLINADIAGTGWRSCFLINLPVGLLALALLSRRIPHTAPLPGQKMDTVGVLLVASAMAALMVPLIQGRELGWPLWTIAMLAVAAALTAAFILHQRHRAAQAQPVLLDPVLFTVKPFAFGLAATLGYYLSNASFFLILALYLQNGHGQAPLQSGLVLTILGLGFFATTLAAPRLERRLGKQIIAVGALTMTFSLLMMWFTSRSIGLEGNPLLIAPWLLLDGLGMGLLMAPLASAVLASAPPQHAGTAAGLMTTLQQLGNALGIALIGLAFYAAHNAQASGAAATVAGFEAGLLYLALLTASVAALVQGMRSLEPVNRL